LFFIFTKESRALRIKNSVGQPDAIAKAKLAVRAAE